MEKSKAWEAEDFEQACEVDKLLSFLFTHSYFILFLKSRNLKYMTCTKTICPYIHSIYTYYYNVMNMCINAQATQDRSNHLTGLLTRFQFLQHKVQAPIPLDARALAAGTCNHHRFADQQITGHCRTRLNIHR